MSGSPIKLPYPRLAKLTDLRTKEISVVAAAPGGGKSTLAVNLAVKMEGSCIYIVQDSPASVMARMASVMLHTPVQQAQRRLHERDPGLVKDFLAHPRHDRLLITSGAHTVPLIEDKLTAFTEWEGKSPDLLILDNLVDTQSEKGGSAENVFYADVLLKLKQLAINHDTHIMVLHHVKKSGNDSERDMGREPMRLKDLLFAGDREARHVWGIYNNGSNVMTVQVLKQQDGMADPLGHMRIPFSWDPAYARLVELGVIT